MLGLARRPPWFRAGLLRWWWQGERANDTSCRGVVDEALQTTITRVWPLGAHDPPRRRSPIRWWPCLEEGPGRGVRLQSGQKRERQITGPVFIRVVVRPGGIASGVCRQTGRAHPPCFDQHLDTSQIDGAPVAVWSPRGKANGVPGVVNPSPLAVDPTVAERFVD